MNKTVDLQKKVSEAIANSLSAISKFKRIKNETTVWSILLFIYLLSNS